MPRRIAAIACSACSAGRTADGDDVERTMIQESLEIVVDGPAVFLREPRGLVAVRCRKRPRSRPPGCARAARACVSLMLPPPRMPDLHPRRRILMLRNQTWLP